MDAIIPAEKDSVGGRSAAWRLVRLLPVAAVLLFAARRTFQMGGLPTGPDGGAWLAIGRGLLGGPGRDTAGAYAPLTPLAIAALVPVVGPVDAVRLVGIASWVVLLLAIGFLAYRRSGPIVTAAVVVSAGGASTICEPLFFGGYPQLLATAALLVAVWSLSWWLVEEHTSALALGAATLGVAGASHHVYGTLALAAAAAVWLLWVVTSRPAWGVVRRRTIGLTAALAFGAAVLVPTLLAFRAAGYRPPLDAARFGPAEAWAYATREAVVPWTAVVLAGVAGLWLARTRRSSEWLAAAGMTLVAGPAMAVSAEPRLVPAILIAAVVGIALALPKPTPAWFGGALLVGAVALAVAGDGVAGAYATFYRVLDRSMLDAAAAIERANPTGLVAVHADRRGWPVGWWYEGLTVQRIAVGSDPRWLGFPGERQRADLVADLFASGRSGEELRRLADDAGVELLVAAKWEWIGWDRWLAEPAPAVVVVFDDDTTIVLRVLPRPPGSAAENAGV